MNLNVRDLMEKLKQHTEEVEAALKDLDWCK
jgi:hypothetical protein